MIRFSTSLSILSEVSRRVPMAASMSIKAWGGSVSGKNSIPWLRFTKTMNINMNRAKVKPIVAALYFNAHFKVFSYRTSNQDKRRSPGNSRIFSSNFRNDDDTVGLKTSATNREDASVITRVIGRYFMNSPTIPGQKINGKNAKSVVTVEAMTAMPTSLVASEAALSNPFPSS